MCWHPHRCLTHTEEVIALSLDTWVSLAVLVTGLAGLYAALHREIRGSVGDLRTELKTDIADLRSELKTDIADLRTELKSDIAGARTEAKADFNRLDDRIFGLAAGLRPLTEAAERAQ